MQLIYLIYDSINNSVFGNQVWQPLVKRAGENKDLQVTLISFETRLISLKYSHPQIKIIQLKRTKFWGKLNLKILAYKIKKYLPEESSPYQLIARGPFAGYIAQQIYTPLCAQLTIQARGLAHAEYEYSSQCSKLRTSPHCLPAEAFLACRSLWSESWVFARSLFRRRGNPLADSREEDRHTHKGLAMTNRNWLKQALIWLRTKQLNNLECTAYQTKQPNIQIECISSALQKYLVSHYHTKLNQTNIAQYDKPTPFTPAQCLEWRIRLRQQLNISNSATVYCYSGSAHLWQCPNLVIEFFKIKLSQNPQAFLLILSNQPEIFTKLIEQAQIPTSHYYTTNVHHQEVYQYLAIANFGMVFREPHLLNWVSRPTKALEYASVELTVLHNNTVNWLMETFPQS